MTANRKLSIALMFCIVLTGISIFLFLQNKTYTSSLNQKNMQVAMQMAWLDSISSSHLASRMNEVLKKTEEELHLTSDRTLSDERIESIAALCFLLKPYASFHRDSLSRKLSPERGQMLLMLSRMNIDAVAFDKIKRKATFADADLRNADFSGADLQGVNLSGADLQNTHLQGTLFSGADLSFANLWGANIKDAQLVGTNLKRATMNWSNLNGANLEDADLQEANLTSAQLRKTNLQNANLEWADLDNAFLNEANLSCADLFRTGMKRAQLEKANFTGARMNLTLLSEANMMQSDLTHAELHEVVLSDQHWLERLNEWQVKGAQEIQFLYKQVEGVSYEYSKYRLIYAEH